MRNHIDNWLIEKRKHSGLFSLKRRCTDGRQTPIYEFMNLGRCTEYVAEWGAPEDTVTIVEPDHAMRNFPWAIQENELHEVSLIIPEAP